MEDFFRHCKVENEFDDTKVKHETAVIGSELVNFIASIMVARFVNRFTSLGLFEKDSYKDLLEDLVSAEKVRSSGEHWLYVQLTKGVQELLGKLGLLPGFDAGYPPKMNRGGAGRLMICTPFR